MLQLRCSGCAGHQIRFEASGFVSQLTSMADFTCTQHQVGLEFRRGYTNSPLFRAAGKKAAYQQRVVQWSLIIPNLNRPIKLDIESAGLFVLSELPRCTSCGHDTGAAVFVMETKGGLVANLIEPHAALFLIPTTSGNRNTSARLLEVCSGSWVCAACWASALRGLRGRHFWSRLEGFGCAKLVQAFRECEEAI